jgi:Protein of unknown function (DUF995)
MKKLLMLVAVLALAAGCTTIEQSMKDSSSLLLSAKEVREFFQGNTVTATGGETFYWDNSGDVIGKGAYGGILKGKWHVTDDGLICASNWDSTSVPGACFIVLFDKSIQQKKLVDMNGDLKYVILNSVPGNPNNF